MVKWSSTCTEPRFDLEKDATATTRTPLVIAPKVLVNANARSSMTDQHVIDALRVTLTTRCADLAIVIQLDVPITPALASALPASSATWVRTVTSAWTDTTVFPIVPNASAIARADST